MVDEDRYGPVDNVTDLDLRWYDNLIPAYLPPGPVDGGASTVNKCPDGIELTEDWQSNIAMNKFITGKKNNGSSSGTVQKPLNTATTSETALLVDSYLGWRSTNPSQMRNDYMYDEPEGGKIARHNLKANVTYLDGHGIAMRANILLSKNDSNNTFWDPEQ